MSLPRILRAIAIGLSAAADEIERELQLEAVTVDAHTHSGELVEQARRIAAAMELRNALHRALHRYSPREKTPQA